MAARGAQRAGGERSAVSARMAAERMLGRSLS
jgi:hypothetical protein